MYSNKCILQIGSHEGDSVNDPMYRHVDSTTRLFLVEPVPYIFARLKRNYMTRFPDSSNIVYINMAVSDHIGEIELTVPSETNDYANLPFWASQLASVDPLHATNHIPGLLVERIRIHTTTIDEILRTYNIQTLDVLHTDTEGHDYTILMAYSFRIKPRKIIFEHQHMDGIFTVGAKYRELSDRLVALGYTKTHQSFEDTVFELANFGALV